MYLSILSLFALLFDPTVQGQSHHDSIRCETSYSTNLWTRYLLYDYVGHTTRTSTYMVMIGGEGA